MTSPFEGKYVIRPTNPVESSDASSEGAVRELSARIEMGDPSLQFTLCRDGVAVSSRPVAERIVSNPRINREGELFIDMDPFLANLA